MQRLDRGVFAGESRDVWPEEKAGALGDTPLLDVLADIEAASSCDAVVGTQSAAITRLVVLRMVARLGYVRAPERDTGGTVLDTVFHTRAHPGYVYVCRRWWIIVGHLLRCAICTVTPSRSRDPGRCVPPLIFPLLLLGTY
jgi:hypothetical protein